MSKELIDRLRRAATVMERWDFDKTRTHSPRDRLHDWAVLMEEAADALEADEDESGPSLFGGKPDLCFWCGEPLGADIHVDGDGNESHPECHYQANPDAASSV